MFLLRFLALAFLTAYSWSMGQIPADGLNDFGKFVSMLFFVVAPALYMLPTIEAALAKHPNLTGIGALNLFLGWSVIGWVAALVWGLKKPSEVVLVAPQAHVHPTAAEATKRCPYCAEEVLSAAIKCKHCGSELAAA